MHPGPGQRNKVYPDHPRPRIDVRKVPAASVPYGESISRNGKTVWAAYDDDGALVCVTATVGEARIKYGAEMSRRLRERTGGVPKS